MNNADRLPLRWSARATAAVITVAMTAAKPPGSQIGKKLLNQDPD